MVITHRHHYHHCQSTSWWFRNTTLYQTCTQILDCSVCLVNEPRLAGIPPETSALWGCLFQNRTRRSHGSVTSTIAWGNAWRWSLFKTARGALFHRFLLFIPLQPIAIILVDALLASVFDLVLGIALLPSNRALLFYSFSFWFLFFPLVCTFYHIRKRFSQTGLVLSINSTYLDISVLSRL